MIRQDYRRKNNTTHTAALTYFLNLLVMLLSCTDSDTAIVQLSVDYVKRLIFIEK